MKKRIFNSIHFLIAAFLIFSGLQSTAAYAQYPEKTIRLILPFPPGGGTDTLARILSEFLSRDLKQTVIVDNRSGAGTVVGSSAVAKASADGYTLLITVPSLVQAPYMLNKPPFDPIKDFTPIAQIVTAPLAIVVNAETGIKTAHDLVEYLKKNPGKHAYATYGTGSSAHLYMNAFTEQAGVDWEHIAYRGEGSMISDLLGGQITAATITGAGAISYVKSGRMNVVALTGSQHLDALPDAMTFEEQGFNRITSRGWIGVFGPANMKQDVVHTLSDSFMRALKDPDVISRIDNLLLLADPMPAEEFARVVKSDNAKWKAVIEEVGIKLD